MSSPEAAVQSAESALAAARKSKDTAAKATALLECYHSYVALPDAFEALKTAKELQKVQEVLGDSKGQAQALLYTGEMNFLLDNLEDALKAEQEALEMFQRLGDRTAQASARDALDQVHKKLGSVESAPNRDKGLAALGELSRAIEANDRTRFSEAMNRCKRMNSVSQQDIEQRLCEAMEKDYVSAARLFKEVLELDGLMPECKATFADKKFAYWGFRTYGGLWYGPAFQCTNGVALNLTQDQCMGAVVIPEGQEAWEHELAYNSGILDGAIQQPFSAGMMQMHSDLANKTFAESRMALPEYAS